MPAYFSLFCASFLRNHMCKNGWLTRIFNLTLEISSNKYCILPVINEVGS